MNFNTTLFLDKVPQSTTSWAYGKNKREIEEQIKKDLAEYKGVVEIVPSSVKYTTSHRRVSIVENFEGWRM